MTQEENLPSGELAAQQLLRQVAEAAPHFELTSIRLMQGTYSAMAPASPTASPSSAIVEYAVDDTRRFLRCQTRLSFSGVPKTEDSKHVVIEAIYELQYVITADVSNDLVSAFARVNAIYNVWPYWREHIATTLWRLGLPTYTLPLLRIQQIVGWVLAQPPVALSPNPSSKSSKASKVSKKRR